MVDRSSRGAKKVNYTSGNDNFRGEIKMDTYRNETIEQQMEAIIGLLAAIEAKESSNLRVQEILKEDGNLLMPFDKALIEGMRRSAAQASFMTSVLATSFDRLVVMAKEMHREMTRKKVKTGTMYGKRLDIILDFEKIAKTLTPAKT